MRWFTSDLHLGHGNVVRYCGRPFTTVDEMNDALVEAWNREVAPDDEVWILGDLAMGRIADTLPLVGDLPGRKHLVLGNHDRPFRGRDPRPGEPPADLWAERYLADGGFVQLHHGEVGLNLSGGNVARLCHFPYEGDSGDQERYADLRPVDDGSWLLHGHVHEKWRQRGRMINVGVDAWAGRPVAETEVVGLVDAGQADLPPLPWT